MIRVIPEAEALALTVRGDVPGVLEGYVGPGLYLGQLDVYDDSVINEPSEWTLPLANPLVQAHLVGWLGRGERHECSACGFPATCAQGGSRLCANHCHHDACSSLRAAFNRYPWLTPESHGGLPDWIRLALIAGSVERVAAGMGPLLGVYTPRSEGARVGYLGEVLADRRAPLHVDEPRTPETCDAYWLSLGIALIDETPAGRVIRFEVPNGP